MVTSSDPVVTCLGLVDPLDRTRSKRLLEQINEYEVSETYVHRISTVQGLQTPALEAARVLFADHQPSGLDLAELSPNAFLATFDDDRVQVGFRARGDAIDDMIEVVDYVLDERRLEVDWLSVASEYSPGGSADGGGDWTEIPDGFVVEKRVREADATTDVGQQLLLETDLRLEDSAATLSDLIDEAIDYTERSAENSTDPFGELPEG